MTSDKLKALAEEIARCCYCSDKMGFTIGPVIEKVVPMLERVQREALTAQIEFPSRNSYIEYLSSSNVNSAMAAYDWVRDNIKIKPNEPVSDRELIDLAADCKWKMPGICDIGALYVAGWRDCEKRLRGEALGDE